MSDLRGKVALVTGAAGGIGEATAWALARLGSLVAVTDLRADAVEDLRERMASAGHRVVAAELDVTDFACWQQVTEHVAHEFGGIDVLAHVAGGGRPESTLPIEQLTPEAWAHGLEMNLTGPFLGMKVVLPWLRKQGGGAIVTVASLSAIRMSTHMGAAYTSAKSGLLGLTRHAAFEFARDRVRVNTVLPGIVDTPAMRAAPAAATEEARGRIPLGEMTTSEQIADAIAFLASDSASGITGEYLVIDGGMQIGSPTSSKVYFDVREEREAQLARG